MAEPGRDEGGTEREWLEGLRLEDRVSERQNGSALSVEVMDDFACIWRAWECDQEDDLEALPDALNRIQFAFEKVVTENRSLREELGHA